MMAQTPMLAHKNPKACLVVGGGGGGIIRELLKHPTVTRVVICEIDQMVKPVIYILHLCI
jgi:spermidine synthase